MSVPSYFFDLDGTLTDPKVGITTCMQYALDKLEQPVPSNDDLEWCIGPPLRQNFVDLVGEGLADQGVVLYRERFADVGLFENVPYDGIHAALGQLKQVGSTLYVASSKAQIFVDQILVKFDLAQYFTQTFGAQLDGTREDKTELLKFALEQTSQSASDATMVGDRKHDAIGAMNNQMKFVGVLYGYGSLTELTSAGVRVFVHKPEELGSLASLGYSG